MPFKPLIILALLISNLCANDLEFVVVASAKTKVVEIEKNDLQKIFLGKIVQIEGEKILPVLIKKEDLQEKFFEIILERSPLQFTRTWQKLVFTGKGKRPVVLNSLADLVDYLRANPYCISFILKSDLSAELREIKVK